MSPLVRRDPNATNMRATCNVASEPEEPERKTWQSLIGGPWTTFNSTGLPTSSGASAVLVSQSDQIKRERVHTVMKEYTAVVEQDPETGLYVGYVPGFPGAHSQADTLDELNTNLSEVMGMLLEDGEPMLEGEFVGTQRVSLP